MLDPRNQANESSRGGVANCPTDLFAAIRKANELLPTAETYLPNVPIRKMVEDTVGMSYADDTKPLAVYKSRCKPSKAKRAKTKN